MMSVRAASFSLVKRCFSANAPSMAAAADPIQELFVDKIRDYSSKKTAAQGSLVDATEATQLELQNELDKVAKAYGGGAGVDMSSFPELKFEEPVIDPINIAQ